MLLLRFVAGEIRKPNLPLERSNQDDFIIFMKCAIAGTFALDAFHWDCMILNGILYLRDDAGIQTYQRWFGKQATDYIMRN